MQLVRTLAAWRPDLTGYRDVEAAYRIALKSLARRYFELHDKIADLDSMIAAIVDELVPDLVTRNSIGHTGAAQLLLTAGGNPERMRSEASFAALCGVSLNRPGIVGGSNFQIGWSHDEQNDEQVFSRGAPTRGQIGA